jgi:glutaredoxin-related protein
MHHPLQHPCSLLHTPTPANLALSFASIVYFVLQFVNGQLVGGLDIMKELKESGELADSLK